MKTTLSRNLFSISILLLAVLAFSPPSDAQVNQVDPAFQPVPSSVPIPPPNGNAKGQILQPDGKIIVWIGNLAVGGVAKGHILRLNSDGTLDNSFSYCSCHLNSVTNIVLQPDGKLLVAGTAPELSSRAKVIRLNPDGSLDPSYNADLPLNAGGASSSFIRLIQSDGKAYIEITNSQGGFVSRAIYRFNTDGSRDTAFTPISVGAGQAIQTVAVELVEQGGKLYLATNSFGGVSSAGSLSRFNTDGTTDSGWQRPSVEPNTSSLIADMDFQADGSLLVSGKFNSINGFTATNLARILPAGNVDLTFAPPGVFEGGLVEVLANGKILWSPKVDISGDLQFYRLKADGTLDPTFVDSTTIPWFGSRWVLDATERIYFFGGDGKFHRLNPNGDTDASFAPDVQDFGKVYAMARQPDGKILMAGLFDEVNGAQRVSMARVNADGSLDTSFNAGTGFDQPPTKLVLQPDGKIIAIGPFNSYNGTTRNGIVRINADGGIDATFVVDAAGVETAALQADGKILIGGTFTSVNGTAKVYLARLLNNGTLDNTFGPIIGGCCGVFDILNQPDGKIMIAGLFSGVDGFTRKDIARLNANGSLDTSFNSTSTSGLRMVRQQPDGRYLAISSAGIIRLNSNGSADPSFQNVSVFHGSGASIDGVVIEPSGAIIIGGRFDTVNSVLRPNLARFSPNGVPDLLFFPKGANGRVRAVIEDGAARVTIGGEFSKVNDVVRAGIARLNVVPYRKTIAFDFDGDGRADISVVRPSTNRWYEVVSSTGAVSEETFGVAGDIPVPADFDGDGATDEAIYRPSSGQWWYHSSVTGGFVLNVYGLPEDIPRPSDFDGDGKADIVLFRPSENKWYRIGSLTPTQLTSFVFGLGGDKPITGDFDGDGKGDMAVFRPSTGDWWYAASSANNAFRTAHWGQNGDIPVPADYDADGKTDFAVFRPSDGGWYIYNSGNGSFTTTAFGTNGDRPVAADYDGDGRADIAVFRPSQGLWYLLRSTAGFAGYQFGISTDTPLPGTLIP